ncbi:MAG: hypothetical protein ACMUIU_00280 [bacterium]
MPAKESTDIDLAIEGISPKDFYKFNGDLLFALAKPLDIVDLSETSKFIQLIQQKGIPLYG